MFEFILDVTSIPSYQTIYFTVLAGLMVKYFLDWNFHFTLTENTIKSDNIDFQHTFTYINRNVESYSNNILFWICKNIRKRTKSTLDDPENHNSYLL